MKNILMLIVMGVLGGCSQEMSADDLVFTSLRTRVFVEDELSSGELVKDEVGVFHYVFEAEDKDLTVLSYNDLLDGYAYDMITEQSYEYERLDLESDGSWYSLMEPGEYFVVVVIADSEDGRYSYTKVILQEGDELEIEKVFDSCCPRFSHEEW